MLKTHSCSLNDENFKTVLAETEGIINSRLLTVETLSDVNSQIPLLPSNLLTQEANVVLPPPGNFSRQTCTHGAYGDEFTGEYHWGILVKKNTFVQSLQI